MFNFHKYLRIQNEDTTDGSQGGGSGADGPGTSEAKGAFEQAPSGMLGGLKRMRGESDGEGNDNADSREDRDGVESDDESSGALKFPDEDERFGDDLDLDYEEFLKPESSENVPGDEDDKDKQEDGVNREDDGDGEEIDIEKLTTADGKKVSREAAAAFTGLKEKLKEREAQLTELQDQLKNTKSVDEFKIKEREREELQKQLDIIDFKKSKAFLEKFHAPVEAAGKKAASWLGSVPPDEASDAKLIISKSNAALDNMSEGDFFDTVDEMIKNHLPGSKGQRFAAAMNTLWEANVSRNNAETDAVEASKTILADRQSMAKSSESVIAATVTSAFKAMEEKESAVLGFYRSDQVKDKFKVDEVMGKARENTQKLLGEFLASGNASQELTSLMVNGAMNPIRNQERELLMGSLHGFQKQLTGKDTEIKKLEAKIKKLTSKGGSFADTTTDSGDDDTLEAYGMVGGLKRMRAS